MIYKEYRRLSILGKITGGNVSTIVVLFLVVDYFSASSTFVIIVQILFSSWAV